MTKSCFLSQLDRRRDQRSKHQPSRGAGDRAAEGKMSFCTIYYPAYIPYITYVAMYMKQTCLRVWHCTRYRWPSPCRTNERKENAKKKKTTKITKSHDRNSDIAQQLPNLASATAAPQIREQESDQRVRINGSQCKCRT